MFAGVVGRPHGPAPSAQVLRYHMGSADDALDEHHVRQFTRGARRISVALHWHELMLAETDRRRSAKVVQHLNAGQALLKRSG